MRSIVLMALLALSLPAAALAEGQATAQPASLQQPAKPKLICRFRTHEGSVVGKPVCATREQWDLAIYKAQQEVVSFQVGSHSH